MCVCVSVSVCVCVCVCVCLCTYACVYTSVNLDPCVHIYEVCDQHILNLTCKIFIIYSAISCIVKIQKKLVGCKHDSFLQIHSQTNEAMKSETFLLQVFTLHLFGID